MTYSARLLLQREENLQGLVQLSFLKLESKQMSDPQSMLKKEKKFPALPWPASRRWATSR